MSAVGEGFDLTGTYVHLADGGAAMAVPVDERFWAEIGERAELHDGRLLFVTPGRGTQHRPLEP